VPDTSDKDEILRVGAGILRIFFGGRSLAAR
jgi:hypothetical protein